MIINLFPVLKLKNLIQGPVCGKEVVIKNYYVIMKIMLIISWYKYR